MPDLTAMAQKPRLLDVHCRWLIRADMPAILAIERLSFEFPWSCDDFLMCLRQPNCIGMVAEERNTVQGFALWELHPNRLHLLNLAVHPDERWRGIGRLMIDKLKFKLQHQKRNRILCEVRERNVGAQMFFKACGFRAIRVLRDFYEDSTEDAYLFEFRAPPLPTLRRIDCGVEQGD